MNDDKNLLRVDTHNHSNNSFDAKDSVKDMFMAAAQKRIDVLAITDHCELEMSDQDDFLPRVEQSWMDMQHVKAENQHIPVELLAGIELGQGIQNRSLAELLLSRHPYDFVISSIHSVRGHEDFYYASKENLQQQGRALLMQYADELLELTDAGLGDTLAHITYPLRYFSNHGVPYDVDLFRESVERVLQSVIKNEMALECNTSGLRQKIGVTLPDEYYLNRYFELGGRLITLCSDSHNVRDLYSGIEETKKTLKKIGFTQAVYYRQRNPVWYNL